MEIQQGGACCHRQGANERSRVGVKDVDPPLGQDKQVVLAHGRALGRWGRDRAQEDALVGVESDSALSLHRHPAVIGRARGQGAWARGHRPQPRAAQDAQRGGRAAGGVHGRDRRRQKVGVPR
ncbi:MAG: hypothetical protein C4305_09245, partial [Thermoleophilia bacterium]